MRTLLLKALVAGSFGGILTWINDGTPMDFAVLYLLFLILMDAGERQ